MKGSIETFQNHSILFLSLFFLFSSGKVGRWGAIYYVRTPFRSRLLYFGTVDMRGIDNSLLWGAVVSTVGYLAAFLASTH